MVLIFVKKLNYISLIIVKFIKGRVTVNVFL
jgi:hypothetical protein